MRESIRRCLSVLMVVAVVGAGTIAMVNLDQGPEPVQQYGPVQEGDALAITTGAVVAAGAGFAVGLAVDELTTQDPEINETQLENTDDAETYAYLHGQAASLGQTSDQFANGVNNTASGLTTILTVDGKTEYISALENSSTLPTKSVAKQQAINKVEEEASKREVAFFAKYQQVALESLSIYQNLEAETNSSYANSKVQTTYWDSPNNWRDFDTSLKPQQTAHTTTLTNGSSYTVTSIAHIGTSGKRLMIPYKPSNTDVDAISVGIRYTGKTNFDTVVIKEPGRWRAAWQNLQDSISEAKTQVSNYIDATHSKYEKGDIKQSDLIDPYVASRNYAPEGDNGAFTRRALTRMGYSVPDNVGEMRDMEIVADGKNLTGIVLTEDGPNQELDVGKTYNVSNLPGTQFVQTDGELYEVEDSLRISAIYDTDGDRLNQSTVAYPEQNWDSTSIEGFQKYLDNQQKILADLNARQDRLRNTSSGGPGGLFDFDGLGASLPYGGAGVAATLGAIVVLGLVTRN